MDIQDLIENKKRHIEIFKKDTSSTADIKLAMAKADLTELEERLRNSRPSD
jgi:hypothetical protein